MFDLLEEEEEEEHANVSLRENELWPSEKAKEEVMFRFSKLLP